MYVKYGGMNLIASPYQVEVFDPSLVRAHSCQRSYINKKFDMYSEYKFWFQAMSYVCLFWF